METCKWCNQPFLQMRDWQLFCCERCCQDWHLHQRKLRRQEKLFAKLRKRDEALAKLSEEELAKLVENSKGTTEQRRRQAGKTLSELASLNGNGEFKHDETYWDKWQ